MRTFRLLKENEIECRISEIAKDGSFLKLLLYKTARTDAALLDETVGAKNWQNDYRMLDGKLYCGIGTRCENDWVWKWNVGTESNMEAEKGQASDAMKRAGFVLGIGTELYSSPEIKVYSDKCTIKEYGGKFKCYDKFSVAKIAYDGNENICGLEIKNDRTGKVVFSFGNKDEKKDEMICSDCKKPIVDAFDANGKKLTAMRISNHSVKSFGRALCYECAIKQKK